MELPKFGEIGELLVTKTAPLVIPNRLIDPNARHVSFHGYPIYFEEQRTGLLIARGTSLEDIGRENNLACVVSQVWTEFNGSAQEGDDVSITTEAFMKKRLQLTFHQTMQRGTEILAEYGMINFFRDKDTLALKRIPQTLIDLLSIPEESLPEDRRYMTGPNTFPYPLPQ